MGVTPILAQLKGKENGKKLEKEINGKKRERITTKGEINIP